LDRKVTLDPQAQLELLVQPAPLELQAHKVFKASLERQARQALVPQARLAHKVQLELRELLAALDLQALLVLLVQ
jgi:hypothetical protein